MSGELYGITCAFFWALSSTLLKSQTNRVGVISLAAWRVVPGLFMFVGLLFLTRRGNDVLYIPLRSWVLLVGSTFLGPGLGDLLYIRSMKLIGLARAMPLTATYPFFTLILALLFLGEQLTWDIVGGALLITGGAYMLAFPQGTARISRSAPPGIDLRGVAMALGAAILWAGDTVMLRPVVRDMDLVVANSVRLSVMMVALFALLLRRGQVGGIRKHGLRPLGITLLAGTLGTGLGTFAWLAALQRAGAAKTSILSATTPLFGVPFSLLLGEKLSSRTVLGTILTVVGVWLTF